VGREKPPHPQLLLAQPASPIRFHFKEQLVPVTLEQTESSTLIQLRGTVDISSAAELKQILSDALGSGKALGIPLADSTGLDVTAVQLLYAAERQANASSAKFAYQGQMPEQVVSALVQAGFESFPIPANPR